jgi:hypothetical protein
MTLIRFNELLRRDDLWVDADAYWSLLATVTPSRRPVREPETVLLVLPDSDAPMQALVLAQHAGDDSFDVYAFVPLSFGPVQERAR